MMKWTDNYPTKENIMCLLQEWLDYDGLKMKYPYDHGRIDEIFEMLVETVCGTAKTYRVAGEERPAEVVKSRFMKLEPVHIEYVLDSFRENTSKVRI